MLSRRQVTPTFTLRQGAEPVAKRLEPAAAVMVFESVGEWADVVATLVGEVFVSPLSRFPGLRVLGPGAAHSADAESDAETRDEEESVFPKHDPSEPTARRRSGGRHCPRSRSARVVASQASASVFVANVDGALRTRPSGPV